MEAQDRVREIYIERKRDSDREREREKVCERESKSFYENFRDFRLLDLPTLTYPNRPDPDLT